MSEFGTVPCPVCGVPIRLRPHPTKAGRIVALCNHGDPTKLAREVYETDEPSFAPDDSPIVTEPDEE
jgi:hypothetical protein